MQINGKALVGSCHQPSGRRILFSEHLRHSSRYPLGRHSALFIAGDPGHRAPVPGRVW